MTARKAKKKKKHKYLAPSVISIISTIVILVYINKFDFTFIPSDDQSYLFPKVY